MTGYDWLDVLIGIGVALPNYLAAVHRRARYRTTQRQHAH